MLVLCLYSDSESKIVFKDLQSDQTINLNAHKNKIVGFDIMPNGLFISICSAGEIIVWNQ